LIIQENKFLPDVLLHHGVDGLIFYIKELLLVSGEQNYPLQAQLETYSAFRQSDYGVNKPELQPHRA